MGQRLRPRSISVVELKDKQRRRLVRTVNKQNRRKQGMPSSKRNERVSRTSQETDALETEKLNNQITPARCTSQSMFHLIYLLVCFYQADAQFHYWSISRQPSRPRLQISFMMHGLWRKLLRLNTRGIGLRLSYRHLPRHACRCTSSSSGSVKRRRLLQMLRIHWRQLMVYLPGLRRRRVDVIAPAELQLLLLWRHDVSCHLMCC